MAVNRIKPVSCESRSGLYIIIPEVECFWQILIFTGYDSFINKLDDGNLEIML